MWSIEVRDHGTDTWRSVCNVVGQGSDAYALQAYRSLLASVGEAGSPSRTSIAAVRLLRLGAVIEASSSDAVSTAQTG